MAADRSPDARDDPEPAHVPPDHVPGPGPETWPWIASGLRSTAMSQDQVLGRGRAGHERVPGRLARLDCDPRPCLRTRSWDVAGRGMSGFRVVSHSDLGGCGDGMQVLREGDALYVGHYVKSGMGTTVLDVSVAVRPKI